MVIWTEFLIIFNISVSVIYTLTILSLFHSTAIDEQMMNFIVVVYTICNLLCCLAIDLGLIYCLKSVIHNYASKWTLNDSGLVNDEYHLLLLLMTRYCSLIIISASIDCITAISILFEIFIGNNYFDKQHFLWTIMNGSFELIDVSTYIVAIYFSIAVNNLIYEKYCFCCHNAIYGGAHKVLQRNSQSQLKELGNNNEYVLMDEMVITKDDSVYAYDGRGSQSSRITDLNGDAESVQSGQSSRRATNYFDDDLYIA